MHYKRVWRHGSVEAILKTPNDWTLEQKLKHHGWTVLESGCWEFSGRRSSSGYGSIDHGGREWVASRAAYTVWVGEIPDGLEVLHSCDYRPCINPEHLRVGTHAENMADMVDKGRSLSRKGEAATNVKLTQAQAEQVLRERDTPLEYHAKLFNVSPTTISKIKTGKNWGWLSGE